MDDLERRALLAEAEATALRDEADRLKVALGRAARALAAVRALAGEWGSDGPLARHLEDRERWRQLRALAADVLREVIEP